MEERPDAVAGEERLRLGDRIREAFPVQRFHGKATACDCEECTEIRDALRGKAWDGVPVEFIDSTCSPVLMTPAALAAFLPAYLLRALDDIEGQTFVMEFTVYALCPNLPDEGSESQTGYKMSKLRDCKNLMSREQVAAIRSFLSFAAHHAANGAWLRRFIEPALDAVWIEP